MREYQSKEMEVASEESTTHSSMCTSCTVKAYKYKCPACPACSCSVVCVKAHKESTGCTGIRGPVVPAHRSEMTDSIFNMDYRFLEGIRMKIVDGFRNHKIHHLQNESVSLGKVVRGNRLHRKNVPRRPNNTFNDPIKTDGSAILPHLLPAQRAKQLRNRIPNYRLGSHIISGSSVQLCRDDVPQMMKRLRYEVRQRGTQLAFMPRDMSRRTVNTSHYVHKQRAIKWHIRVEFLQADVFFEDTVDERTSVGRVVAKFINTSLDQLKGQSLLKVHPPHALKAPVAPQNSNTRFDEAWSEKRTVVNTAGTNSNSEKICINYDSEISEETNKLTSSQSLQKSNNINDIITEISNVADRVLNISEKKNCASVGDVEMQDLSINAYSTTLNTFCDVKPAKRFNIISRASPADCDPYSNRSNQLSDEQVEQMMLYTAAGIGGLAVLCKNEKFDDNEKYRQFEVSESLRENLSGMRVVEHPILIVVKKDHAYEFLTQNNRYADPELERILKSRTPTTVASAAAAPEKKDESNFAYFNADCPEYQYLEEEM